MTTPTFKPPGTLKPDTARWWRKVAADYVLEEHHLRLLTLAAYAWDRADTARRTIQASGGTTFVLSLIHI